MNFIRRLIEIPVIILVIVFAVNNNEFTTFKMELFKLEVTISVSVLVLVLFFLGYLFGRLDSFVANAPLRSALRQQKKTNKVLNKEHEKLNAKFSDLQEDFESMKIKEEQARKDIKANRIPLKQKFSEFFSFKKDKE